MTSSGVATAVELDDQEPERWFATIVDTSANVAEEDPEAGWDVLADRLASALADAGFADDTIGRLRYHLDGLAGAGWTAADLVGELTATGAEHLAEEYHQIRPPAGSDGAAHDGAGYNEDAWAGYLAALVEHHVQWDGTADSWADFRHAVLAWAESWGVAPAAQQLVDLAETPGSDAAALLGQYGLISPAPVAPSEPSDGEPAPAEPPAEPTAEPTAELTAEVAAELVEEVPDDVLAEEVRQLRESDPALAALSAEQVSELLKERVAAHLQALAPPTDPNADGSRP